MKKLILVLVLILMFVFPLMASAAEEANAITFSGLFKIDADFDFIGTPLKYGDKTELKAAYAISESMGFEVKFVLTDLIFEDPFGVDMKTTLTFDITDDLVGKLILELDLLEKSGNISFEIAF